NSRTAATPITEAASSNSVISSAVGIGGRMAQTARGTGCGQQFPCQLSHPESIIGALLLQR
ncbi:MAG TPA: hypothetical protein VEE84_02645, partial [Burkholderiaceae bacterium]|nr:hypothetical protein [Burkholderiaceae bacterium]